MDTNVEFSGGNNWIIWRPDININANELYTLRVSNIDQAKQLPPNPTFKVFVVQDREIKAVNNYLPITGFLAASLTPSDLTFISDEMVAGQIPKNKYQRWLLTVNHPLHTIPAGSILQIVLPTTLTVVDNHCYNHPTSNLKNPATSDITIFCRWEAATNSFVVSNLDISPTSDSIKILFYATSENASPGAGSASPVLVRFYKDASRQLQILQGSVSSPAIAN